MTIVGLLGIGGIVVIFSDYLQDFLIQPFLIILPNLVASVAN